LQKFDKKPLETANPITGSQMLLRFCVTNHRSLRDQQELSLVASPLKDDDTGLIDCHYAPDGYLLPSAVIYGANASGKTNLLDAIRWMRRAVRTSHTEGEPGRKPLRRSFALDPDYSDKPSRFEIDFVMENVRYDYGFEAAEREYTSEWLYSYPNDRRQVLFSRDNGEFHFGRNLKGRNQVISELTRPDSLFLSAAVQNSHEELTRVGNYFSTLGVIDDSISSPDRFARHLMAKGEDHRVTKILAAAGTGVATYRASEAEPDEAVKKVYESFQSLLTKLNDDIGASARIELDGYDGKVREIKLGHQAKGDEVVFLDFDVESAGTKRLLRMLTQIFSALDAGHVLVIDELDDSLHTQACELVVSLFSSKTTNPNGAQLIATTHDTNLLCSPSLRRDQIWLTEKDASGASHLYPLTDFKTRKTDNFARGYLQGRYGAVPFSGNVRDLLTEI
jgi:AAA15 family ATPase/GTPase